MQRRIAAVIVVLVGVALLVVTFNESLFDVGPAFEELTDDFRPIMTDEFLAGLDQDVDGLVAVSDEFGSAVVPALSQALGQSPEQFQVFVAAEFPAVATGVQALPAVAAEFDAIVGVLQSQVDNFQSADLIPIEDLSATTVPWGIFLAAIATIIVGILMWFSARAAIAAIALGALLVAGPLAVTLLDKSTSADDMNDALKPVYTAELVAGAEQALGVVGAMGQSMQTDLLPALGQQLNMDAATLNGFLAENFPATAAGLQRLPVALGTFADVVDTFDTQLPNYEILKPVTLNPIVWTVIIGGLIVAVAGLWGFVAGRREGEPAPASEPEPAPDAV